MLSSSSHEKSAELSNVDFFFELYFIFIMSRSISRANVYSTSGDRSTLPFLAGDYGALRGLTLLRKSEN